jgi:hypothetical protein
VDIAEHHAATRARAKVLIATLLFRDNLPSHTPNAAKVVKWWTKLICLERSLRVIASGEPSMQHLIRCATVQAARRRAAVKVVRCLNQFSPKGSRQLCIKYAGSGLRVEGLQHAFGHAILVLGEGGRRFKAYAASCENASEECDEPCWAITFWPSFIHGALIHRSRSRFMDGHHGHPGHHGHSSARARVVACPSVKHHQPSLAPVPAPAPTPAGQHHRPGLARLCPALLSATLLRYRRTLSGFPYGIGQRLEHGRFEMMDAYSFGFGCCLLSVWFSFGFRLVFV